MMSCLRLWSLNGKPSAGRMEKHCQPANIQILSCSSISHVDPKEGITYLRCVSCGGSRSPGPSRRGRAIRLAGCSPLHPPPCAELRLPVLHTESIHRRHYLGRYLLSAPQDPLLPALLLISDISAITYALKTRLPRKLSVPSVAGGEKHLDGRYRCALRPIFRVIGSFTELLGGPGANRGWRTASSHDHSHTTGVVVGIVMPYHQNLGIWLACPMKVDFLSNN